MADARVQHDWAQTSSVMALLANCHRDPRKFSAFKPGDFDPTRQDNHSRLADKSDLQFLKQVFQRKDSQCTASLGHRSSS